MTVINLGPTGEYPSGKLEPEDNGELTLAIGAVGGLVRVEFGAGVSWIAMPPDTARQMAASLTQMADQAEGEQS